MTKKFPDPYREGKGARFINKGVELRYHHFREKQRG